MDLGAYINIDNLSIVAKRNGIEIPRLRGYRLMGQEQPMSEEDIEHMVQRRFISDLEFECDRQSQFWLGSYGAHKDNKYGMSKNPERYIHFAAPGSDEEDYVMWDKIHGKLKKHLKLMEKHRRRDVEKQMYVFNKYAGREDVLYIHSRMGGWNWAMYEDKDKILNAPWFLDRVDDSYDNTYCDFYAKIK